MSAPRVVIFNDTHGWHSDQLSTALGHLGIEAVLADLAACQIDLDTSSGLRIPGFDKALPGSGHCSRYCARLAGANHTANGCSSYAGRAGYSCPEPGHGH